ncbi:MAG TPA: radical SAM protein, partial [Saprospiraceae bacterium]|nr:radical SAM protein [Saprospiraceae bacterium]
MSGIYIHIPFCKQACHYCNFHFSTSLKSKGDLVSAICKEIIIQKDYLKEKSLTSVYFGGGTPSLLTEDELGQIFDTLNKVFTWTENTEITLEANPDDITLEKLNSFKKWGVNRLSIGIQSFFNEDLIWMNRAHNAQEAQTCIKLAQDVGFDNITIDLIYGSPTTSHDMW